MSVQSIRKNFCVLIYLISCVLNRRKPKKELLEGVNLDHIRNMARDHSLSSLLSAALESVGLASNEDIEKKNLAIRKIMLLDAERAAILSELESRGIRHMALKGVVLKELYPSIGLRQMADNDILFDSDARGEMKQIMVARGYDVYAYNHSNHDVYLKEPVYNFEMHVSLFSPNKSHNFEAYFANALEVSRKNAGSSYGYSMTDEYFYLYLKAHEYKHWVHSGTGLRSLVDTYVYLKAKQDSMDREYLDSELKRLDILSYEEMTRALALKIFDPDFAESNIDGAMLSEDEVRELDNFLFYGTYGTFAKQVSNDLDKTVTGEKNTFGQKLRYIMKSLFPPVEFYRVYSPLAYKHRWLIPFIAIKRIFIAITRRPKENLSKLGAIIKYKQNKK